MNIFGNASETIKVRVLNNTGSSLRVLLYQSEIEVTADTYLAGVWRQAMLAKGATMTATLPIDLAVGAAEEGKELQVATKTVDAPQKSKFEVFTDDHGALDIKNTEAKTKDGTIAVMNTCESAKWVKAYKDGSPILSVEVRPEFTESISIHPKLGFAVGAQEIETAFFNAAELSKVTEADLHNQSFVTFELTENMGTKAISVAVNYDKF